MSKLIMMIAGAILLLVLPGQNAFNKRIDKIIRKKLHVEAYQKKIVDIPGDTNIQLYGIIKNDSLYGYYTVNKVNTCRSGGCAVSNGDNSFQYEYFWYILLMDSNLDIEHVQILEYNATYGHEICSKRWLRQFTNQQNKDFRYAKNIDAISGATISGIAITKHINLLRKKINTHKAAIQPFTDSF